MLNLECEGSDWGIIAFFTSFAIVGNLVAPSHSKIFLANCMCLAIFSQKEASSDRMAIKFWKSNQNVDIVWRVIDARKNLDPHWDWVPPTLGQTQHYNVLCATYHKTSEQGRQVIHTGVGYKPPTPH